MKKILLLTDNEELLFRFRELVKKKNLAKSGDYEFHYAYSSNNKAFAEKFENSDWIKPIKIKVNEDFLAKEYNLIFSLHCKQIFPGHLITSVKCINIHPGLNPNNRGWFPQVFSIINGLPGGATIHEIDKDLDHGPIIDQKEVNFESWDTSFTAYNKILDAEIELLDKNFENILRNNYKTYSVAEGNLNLKKDFDQLCEIDLKDTDTFFNHINKLRALTHGNYSNAFFVDGNGNKIFIKVELSKQ